MNYRKELYESNFKKTDIIWGPSWNIAIGLALKGP